MTSERAKVGAADPKLFDIKDGDGRSARLDQAIVPILKQDKDAAWHLVGTGFYICNVGILATAKHVLTDVIDDQGNQTHALACIHFLPESQYLIRPILRCCVHNSSDVGIGICAPMTHNPTGNPLLNKVLTLSDDPPDIGERVFTYAYPTTVIEPGTIQTLRFSPAFYEGVITGAFPSGRDKVMMPSPCYQTSIVMHGGASGGPVFREHGGGVVFGINSTGFDGCIDVSFVSRIDELFSLRATDVKLTPEAPAGDVSLARLVELGQILVRRSQKGSKGLSKDPT